MAVPVDRESFKDACMRRLGWPVIQINVDDDQVEDRIDEAFEYYYQFHFDATQKTYYKYQITATDVTNGWIPVDSSFYGITRIFPVNTQLFSNNMFSFNYQFALNDLYSFTGGQLQNYVITLQTLRTIEMLLVGEAPVRFNRHTNRLYIDFNWGVNIQSGQWLIIEALQALDPDVYQDVWADRILQKYATALLKRQWGSNLKKYTGVQMPGGVTFNGQQIFDEAMQEIAEIEHEIETTYQEPPRIMFG